MNKNIKKIAIIFLLVMVFFLGVIFCKLFFKKAGRQLVELPAAVTATPEQPAVQNNLTVEPSYLTWSIAGTSLDKNTLRVAYNVPDDNKATVFEIQFPKKLSIFSGAATPFSSYLGKSSSLLVLEYPANDEALKNNWLYSANLSVFVYRDKATVTECSNTPNATSTSLLWSDVTTTTINGQQFSIYGEIEGGMEAITPVINYFTVYNNSCVVFAFAFNQAKYHDGIWAKDFKKDGTKLKQDFESIVKSVVFYRY